MAEKEFKSWWVKHPHVTRWAYAVVAVALVITLVFTFGRDTVKGWVEGVARSAGYELTVIPEEPEEVKP